MKWIAIELHDLTVNGEKEYVYKKENTII